MIDLETRCRALNYPLLSPLDPFARDPDSLTDREREEARRHPEREVLLLAAAGAAKVLGARHGLRGSW